MIKMEYIRSKTEKREFQRIIINQEVLLYFKEKEKNDYEHAGIIKDISERGISFILPRETDISLGDIVEFQFADSITNFEGVIHGKAKIIRTACDKERILIGCSLINFFEIENYVKNKKVDKYIKVLRAIAK